MAFPSFLLPSGFMADESRPTVRPGGRPDLGALERKILKDHPAILAAIEAEDEEDIVPPRPSDDARILINIFAVVGLAALLLAPILGVAIYGEHPYLGNIPRTPPSTSIPAAGMCFIVTLVGQLVVAIRWVKRGATWSGPTALYGAYTAVFAILTATGTGNLVEASGYDAGAWRVPVFIAIFSGLLLTLAALLRFGAKTKVSSRATGVERIRQEVSRLPVFDRADLKRRRNFAIDDLAEQGLIDAQLRLSAIGEPLGQLTHLEKVRRRIDLYGR